MPTLLQINITANWGSHGKIAEGIGIVAISHGWKSYIAYGRWWNESKSTLYHIGSNFDEMKHLICSRLFDNHGRMSKHATQKLIAYIEDIKPDIIHLHNIHGYYLNYPILFKYLNQCGIPIVWTLHDCWPYTGHCAHYMFNNCEKWKSHCQNCQYGKNYPKRILWDQSFHNFEDKKHYFSSLKNITLIPVSRWLANDLKKSFLSRLTSIQIYNGINVNVFKPNKDTTAIKQKYHIPDSKKIILGVASNWYHKGIPDFIRLSSLLDNSYIVVLVGVISKDIKQLSKTDIITVKRTENVNELIALYSMADVYFNPTWEDNFPTTNIEALSCGTPVITYDTGGSSESIDAETGFTIKPGDIDNAKKYIEIICNNGKGTYTVKCRQRVLDNFNKDDRFMDYFNLYNKLLKK